MFLILLIPANTVILLTYIATEMAVEEILVGVFGEELWELSEDT